MKKPHGKNLKTETGREGLVITVPGKAVDTIATVIKLEVKGKVDNGVAVPKDKMKAGELD